MTSLIQKLNEILSIHATKRVNGKVASHSTTTSAGQTLRTCFSDLTELGYRLQDPHNLSEKHLTALCVHWRANGRATSTIQERLSRLRVFAGWIEKPGLVKSLATYLPDVPAKELRVRKVADKSKGWTENDIDVAAKIREADMLDRRFGMMLRVALAFGLRRMEVVQLRPWKSDRGDKLAVYHAKNGRPRDVYMDTPEQRTVLDQVKASVSKSGHLGWAHTTRGEVATLEYSIARYNKCMAKIGITREEAGVTGHGLRAQYAENAALIAQMIPPTLGGTGGQMSRDDLMMKRAQVSELLGHSRVSITGSYYGSFGRNATPDDADRCKANISGGLTKLADQLLVPVPPERMPDCIQLVGELSLLDIEVTAKQAYHLWHLHSLRHGQDWVKPRKGNAEAMEVEAMKINRSGHKESRASVPRS
jgi:integrase